MWEINAVNQIITFSAAFILGCLCSVIYCIIHSASKFIGNVFILNIFDFIFWIICCLLNFFFFLARTNGEIRIFVFASEIMGFCILYFCLGNKLVKLFLKIFAVIYAVNGAFFRIVQYICEKIINFTLKYLKKLKKLLKNIWHLLYTVFYKDKRIEK